MTLSLETCQEHPRHGHTSSTSFFFNDLIKIFTPMAVFVTKMSEIAPFIEMRPPYPIFQASIER